MKFDVVTIFFRNRRFRFAKLAHGSSTFLANFEIHKSELDYFGNNHCTSTRHYYDGDYNELSNLLIIKIPQNLMTSQQTLPL
jgi:hypothetical protein